jgi:hypothetical protein
MEIVGTDAFCEIGTESTATCPLGWEGVVLLMSTKTGIGTSAPEVAAVLARSKTPRPTLSGAYKTRMEKYGPKGVRIRLHIPCPSPSLLEVLELGPLVAICAHFYPPKPLVLSSPDTRR